MMKSFFVVLFRAMVVVFSVVLFQTALVFVEVGWWGFSNDLLIPSIVAMMIGVLVSLVSIVCFLMALTPKRWWKKIQSKRDLSMV